MVNISGALNASIASNATSNATSDATSDAAVFPAMQPAMQQGMSFENWGRWRQIQLAISAGTLIMLMAAKAAS